MKIWSGRFQRLNANRRVDQEGQFKIHLHFRVSFNAHECSLLQMVFHLNCNLRGELLRICHIEMFIVVTIYLRWAMNHSLDTLIRNVAHILKCIGNVCIYKISHLNCWCERASVEYVTNTWGWFYAMIHSHRINTCMIVTLICSNARSYDFL